jgi:hypothetical protein
MIQTANSIQGLLDRDAAEMVTGAADAKRSGDAAKLVSP